MRNRHHQFGRKSEAAAVRYLTEIGYRILARNYQTRQGEIDIIAQDGDTIVFVEVKARRSAYFGSPKAAVTRAKQRKMSLTAQTYLKAANRSHAKARFDVLAMKPTDSQHPETQSSPGDHGAFRMELVRNAFELASE